MTVSQELIAIAPQLAGWSAAAGLTVAAKNTIGRVLGAGADLLLGPVDDLVQASKDRRSGRSLARQTIAAAAAKRLGEDAAIVERAMLTMLGEATRKQKARESVSSAAMEDLAENPSSESAPEPHEDWINLFSSYAERASSERMRRLWGSILAGEIRKAGSFSPATMRALAEMTQRTADCFEQFSKYNFGGRVFSTGHVGKDVLDDLEIAGLINSSGSAMYYDLNVRSEWSGIEGNFVRILFKVKKKAMISSVGYSSIGLELKSLIKARSELDVARHIAEYIKGRDGGAEIIWGEFNVGKPGLLNQFSL